MLNLQPDVRMAGTLADQTVPQHFHHVIYFLATMKYAFLKIPSSYMLNKILPQV